MSGGLATMALWHAVSHIRGCNEVETERADRATVSEGSRANDGRMKSPGTMPAVLAQWACVAVPALVLLFLFAPGLPFQVGLLVAIAFLAGGIHTVGSQPPSPPSTRQ